MFEMRAWKRALLASIFVFSVTGFVPCGSTPKIKTVANIVGLLAGLTEIAGGISLICDWTSERQNEVVACIAIAHAINAAICVPHTFIARHDEMNIYGHVPEGPISSPRDVFVTNFALAILGGRIATGSYTGWWVDWTKLSCFALCGCVNTYNSTQALLSSGSMRANVDPLKAGAACLALATDALVIGDICPAWNRYAMLVGGTLLFGESVAAAMNSDSTALNGWHALVGLGTMGGAAATFVFEEQKKYIATGAALSAAALWLYQMVIEIRSNR